jgi:ABC-type amino acid transport system permease subunit
MIFELIVFIIWLSIIIGIFYGLIFAISKIDENIIERERKNEDVSYLKFWRGVVIFFIVIISVSLLYNLYRVYYTGNFPLITSGYSPMPTGAASNRNLELTRLIRPTPVGAATSQNYIV